MASTISSRLSQIRSAGVDGGLGHSTLRLIGIAVGIVIVLMLLPTTVTYIHPGHVGIVISRTGGGVEPTPLAAGLHTRNPLTTGIEEYPIYMQTLVLAKTPTEGTPENEEINVNSVEGQPISLDVAMSFELDAAQVPELYKTFRNNIDFIQHTYVKQTIRQALQTVIGSEAIADILGPKKAEVVGRTQDQGLARLLATRERFDRTMKFDAAFESKIGALTAEQVNAAVRRHLDPAGFIIVKAGDFKKAGVLQ